MANVKDEGKKMDPLFPRFHISDADKGGPRTPPRNKMAISQQFNQQSQRCISGSVSPILPSQSSSYHDSSYKRSVFSSFGRSCGSTRLATRLDSYQSSGINLNISLTTVKQTIETTNCQTLCNVGQLKSGDYSLFRPQDFRSTRNSSVKKLEDEDDHLLPSLSVGNDQHNRGKFPTLSTNSHIKHPIACQKQLKLIDNDTTQENKLNSTMIKDIAKDQRPMSYYSDRVRFSEMLSGEVSPSYPRKRSMSIDESHMSHNQIIRLPLKRKSFQENMSYKSEENHGSLLEDNFKTDRSIHEVRVPIEKSEEDRDSLHLEDIRKNGDILETNFLSGYNIAPEEVSQVIGHEQYCIARRTIIQQQRVFQSQLFELHRLIKVQKLLAESPDLLLEDNFFKLKKSHSEDNFVHVSHHKKESNLSFPIDRTIRKPIHNNNDTDIRYNPNLIDLPAPPPTTINGSKQPPWCFLPPPPLGNQWLVPVRSPSEGLVYKPFTGPSPPPVGLMTPIYGMSLTPSDNDFMIASYNIPTSYQQGINVFPSIPLFTSYGLPTITKPSCSPTIETDGNYSKSIKTTCNLLTQDNKESDDDLQGSHERKKGDELQLFPTTPMVKDSDQEKGFDERIKVIKVRPHNPKLASESAARIFQFIQEERKHNE